MSDDHDVKLPCGCRDCYRGSTVERDPCRKHAWETIVTLTAQLQTERELFESTIRLKDEIAKHRDEAEAKRDQLYADLTAARARADAMEGEAGALRLAMDNIKQNTCDPTVGHHYQPEIAANRIATDALSGTAGIRAAEVLQVVRDVVEHDDRVNAGKLLKTYEGEFLRRKLRAALAAHDGGGDDNGK